MEFTVAQGQLGRPAAAKGKLTRWTAATDARRWSQRQAVSRPAVKTARSAAARPASQPSAL